MSVSLPIIHPLAPLTEPISIECPKASLAEQGSTGIQGQLCQPRAKPTSVHPRKKGLLLQVGGVNQCNTFHYELS